MASVRDGGQPSSGRRAARRASSTNACFAFRYCRRSSAKDPSLAPVSPRLAVPADDVAPPGSANRGETLSIVINALAPPLHVSPGGLQGRGVLKRPRHRLPFRILARQQHNPLLRLPQLPVTTLEQADA